MRCYKNLLPSRGDLKATEFVILCQMAVACSSYDPKTDSSSSHEELKIMADSRD